MHDQSWVENKYYPSDLSVLDPMERKALSRFLPHTDITVSQGKYTKYALNSIEFKRTNSTDYQTKKFRKKRQIRDCEQLKKTC